jgi:hypothetical protein
MKSLIHVWHDPKGKIIAVGKPAKHMVDRVQPLPANPSHSVISTEVEDNVIPKLHQTHFVAVADSKLKLKS